MLKKWCPATQGEVSSVPGIKWFLLPLIFFFLDQISKGWVVTNLYFGQIRPLFPSLNVTLTYNRGIAFSLFTRSEAWGQILLIIMICLICIFIAYWLIKTPTDEKWTGISLSLILGGALGNLYDRVSHGYVIDFIDFYVSSWHWYTFNLADSFITIGAIMGIKTILLTPAKT